MRGLIIKDLKLLKSQRMFLIVVAAGSILFLINGSDPGFVFSYVSAMFSMLVITTISFDEENNGMSFIMTLPVSRKKYVLEKYVFGILLQLMIFVCGTAVLTVILAAKQTGSDTLLWLELLAQLMLVSAVIQSVTIPVQLKFGASKSRLALMLVFLCFAAAAYGTEKIGTALDIDLEDVWYRLQMIKPQTVMAGIFILAAVMLGISCAVSVRVMKQKQF